MLAIRQCRYDVSQLPPPVIAEVTYVIIIQNISHSRISVYRKLQIVPHSRIGHINPTLIFQQCHEIRWSVNRSPGNEILTVQISRNLRPLFVSGQFITAAAHRHIFRIPISLTPLPIVDCVQQNPTGLSWILDIHRYRKRNGKLTLLNGIATGIQTFVTRHINHGSIRLSIIVQTGNDTFTVIYHCRKHARVIRQSGTWSICHMSGYTGYTSRLKIGKRQIIPNLCPVNAIYHEFILGNPEFQSRIAQKDIMEFIHRFVIIMWTNTISMIFAIMRWKQFYFS